MKRLFSGSLSPRTISQNSSRSRSNSSSSLPPPPAHLNPSSNEPISPEISPIITLLSAQTHRRYNEGIFMIIQSIDSEGKSIPNCKWREVYGILIGTQLAIWNIEELEEHQNNTEALMNASSKPDYLNFSDASFRHAGTLEGNKSLKNVIIVSTTFKNQYLLQYNDLEEFHRWNSAFRLSSFEYTSLQEAYTGSLLSSRGSKLSDIRTILAETKFDYEDWVSVRFGAGAKWKRCYAVIEQPSKKAKKGVIPKGMITFYKDEKKSKKHAMAVIKDAGSAYALYPNSVKMIDHSTMIKLEGNVSFDLSKNALQKESTVYFMPEQHSAVPGYDTLIRFLIPLLNTFVLYGRPKRLNANKTEKNSLLFGLPVLPHVHYLEIDDIILLSNNSSSGQWSASEWRERIKEILSRKLNSGYTGTGSSHGLIGALNSPVISSSEFFDSKYQRPGSPLSPKLSNGTFRDQVSSKRSSLNPASSSEELLGVDASPGKSRNSGITQIYEDYSKFGSKNGVSPELSDRSHFSNPSLQQPAVLNATANSSKHSIPQIQINSPQDPYEAYKNDKKKITGAAPNERSLVDDDDEEFFDDEEILNNKISALAINNKPSTVGNNDVFNPAYDSANDKLREVNASLNSRHSSPVKQTLPEQSMAYTSGRINQARPMDSKPPMGATISQESVHSRERSPQAHIQTLPATEPQTQTKRSPIPHSQAYQSLSSQKQEQPQEHAYQQQNYQQQPPPPPHQQFPDRQSPQQAPAFQPPLQEYRQPPPHQAPSNRNAQQQAYQQQPVPQQQYNRPPQQQQIYPPQHQQPQQTLPSQQKYQQQPPPQQGFPSNGQQPRMQMAPQQHIHQHQQQRPYPTNNMNSPNPQQHPPYNQRPPNQGYPSYNGSPQPQQAPVKRMPPQGSVHAQKAGYQYNQYQQPPPQQQQYPPPQQQQYPPPQQQQYPPPQQYQQPPHPQQQQFTRRGSDPYVQQQTNPYAQGNPYQR